jgi:hypothetical protein
MSASDDLPPDLEEPVLRTKARVTAPSPSPTSPLQASVPLPNSNLPPAAVVVPISDDEPESLASQMLSASSASLAARAAKSAEDEKAAAKAALSGNFLSGNAIRKGFLLGGGGGGSTKKSASGDTTSTTPTASSSSSILTTRGNLDLIIEPKGSSSSGGNKTGAASGGRNASLQLPEVQSAMASPSFAAKLSDGAWVTPALMQRIAGDPRLVAGMQNPRFMEAFNAMQKDAKGTMERARGDPPLADFLQRFMAVLSAHFTELGEKEDQEKAAKTATALAATVSEKTTTTTKTAATSAAVTAATAEKQTTMAAAATKTAGSDIGLAPKESRRLAAPRGESLAPPKASTPPPLAGLGADTKAITTAAALGELPAGTPDDVRAVLSNPALVEALNDPQIRSILEECRSDPYALRKYLGDVNVRRKLDALSKAGLIQLS